MGTYLNRPITKKTIEEGQTQQFKYACVAMQGWRRTMEDAHVIKEQLNNKPNQAFFGLFDGHGGPEVARFCASHMHQEIVVEDSYQKGEVKESLTDVFYKIDLLLRSQRYSQELEQHTPKENRIDRARSHDIRDEHKISGLFKKMLTHSIHKPEELEHDDQHSPSSKLQAHLKHIKSRSHHNSLEQRKVTKAGTTSQKAQSEYIHDEGIKQKQQSKELPQLQQQQLNQQQLVNGQKRRDSFNLEKNTECKDQNQNLNANDSNRPQQDSLKQQQQQQQQQQIGQQKEQYQQQQKQQQQYHEELQSNQASKNDMSKSDGAISVKYKHALQDEPQEGQIQGCHNKHESFLQKDNSRKQSHNLQSLDLELINQRGEEETGHQVEAGCTANVILLMGDKLYIANAGDSRAIMCRRGRAIALSEDHKPGIQREVARIEHAGGSLIMIEGIYRVNGNLSLSRAIGDLHYKNDPNLLAAEQIISAEPDVKQYKLDDKDEFFVMACDGIWDVMVNQQVCDFVRKQILELNKGLAEAASSLLDQCLARDPRRAQGIGADNMTVIIVQLKGSS